MQDFIANSTIKNQAGGYKLKQYMDFNNFKFAYWKEQLPCLGLNKELSMLVDQNPILT